MNQHIRRIAATLSVTLLLSVPVFAAPPRDGNAAPQKPVLERVIKRIMDKLARLMPTSSLPIGPIPPPEDKN
jgi:hypothetical protein